MSPRHDAGPRVVGVDLGGTKLLVARVVDGEVVDHRKVPTPTGGPDAIVSAIVELVADLGGADRVGVGTPGAVDPTSGIVRYAPNLQGFDEPVPFTSLLDDALPGDTVVAVDNDVNVGTLGELRAGAAKGEADVLAVFAGTGVGGGLVLDGAVRRGPRGVAGEIGHIEVPGDGRPCGCGLRDHVESFAGRTNMEAEARRRHEQGEATLLVDQAGEGRMKSRTFAKAVQKGDPLAVLLVEEAVQALGVAVATAVTLLDLPLVVLGGGLAGRLGDPFVARVEQAAAARVPAGLPVRVVPAALGDYSGVVGAAALVA